MYDSKILVPSDGSKTAQKAAGYAVDLAKQLKASMIALSVIDKRSFIAQTVPASETASHTIEPIEDYLREAAEGYAGEIKKLCDKKRCRIEDFYKDGASCGGDCERGQEVKGKSYCYGLPWKERLISHSPW